MQGLRIKHGCFGFKGSDSKRGQLNGQGPALSSVWVKMLGSTKLYSLLGVAFLILFLFSLFGGWLQILMLRKPHMEFVQRNGYQFVLDGKPLYINGWNSYWLMAQSVDYTTRSRVATVLKAGADMGLLVCRTWAFNDGGYNALQISPGKFNEDVFKRVLTRTNSLNGITYKEEPAIFAWELINEPRCLSDVSGQTLKAWIQEMASFVKSIDGNHLLTVGLEGFYGPSMPEKFEMNPGNWARTLGSDFIHGSAITEIDFASVHAYPDSWLPNTELPEKLEYFSKWVDSHIQDGDEILKKPVLFTEFGLSSLCKDYEASQRDLLLKKMYDRVYESAIRREAGAGAMVWQFVVEGMEDSQDEFALIPWQRSSTFQLIVNQSCRLQTLRDNAYNKKVCKKATKHVR